MRVDSRVARGVESNRRISDAGTALVAMMMWGQLRCEERMRRENQPTIFTMLSRIGRARRQCFGNMLVTNDVAEAKLQRPPILEPVSKYDDVKKLQPRLEGTCGNEIPDRPLASIQHSFHAQRSSEWNISARQLRGCVFT